MENEYGYTSQEKSEDGIELERVRSEFDKIFENIEEISNRIIDSFIEIFNKYGLNPGKVDLYMTGGRVKGKPLKEDSDIDLIFAVEKTRYEGDVLTISDLENVAKREVIQNITAICQEFGIANKFHILQYDANINGEFNSSDYRLIASTS